MSIKNNSVIETKPQVMFMITYGQQRNDELDEPDIIELTIEDYCNTLVNIYDRKDFTMRNAWVIRIDVEKKNGIGMTYID